MTSFSAAEQTVLDELVRLSSSLQDYSLSDLANQCHVAKSTVSKTIKKLGFEGYNDFIYTYKLNSNIQRDRLLQQQVVEGDEDQAIHNLAGILKAGTYAKNIICSLGNPEVIPLANYISRKLSMFDMFAPSTYDYTVYDYVNLKPGFVIAFPRKLPNKYFGIEFTPSWDSQLSLFHSKGYTVVSITDDPALQKQLSSDLPITIHSSKVHNSDPDFFIANVLVLFENTLGNYAHQMQSTKHSTTNKNTDRSSALCNS